MSELKRCPFCGGEAEFYRTAIKTNGSWCDSVVVKCKECEARTGRILYDAQKHPNDKEYDEAAVLWNTRKPVDAVLEHLEEEKQNALKLWDNNSRYMGYEHSIKIVKENLT